MLRPTLLARAGAAVLTTLSLAAIPLARAQPDIPDLSLLPQVNAYDYFGTGTYQHPFRPAPDIWCAMSYSRFSNDTTCTGHLPGVPEGDNHVSVYWAMLDHHTGRAQITSTTQSPPAPQLQHFYRPLPPGHALALPSNYEVAAQICGSPPGYVLVCRIDAAPKDLTPESHGFVLSETGSWTF